MRAQLKHGLIMAITAALATQPAQACWNAAEQDAAKISSFNMLLMVSALRCRNGADNFLIEYNAFVRSNNAVLGAQNGLIRQQFSRALGPNRAESAADQFTIGFANHFGAGHETLGCAELKALAFEASLNSNSVNALAALADQTVGLPSLPGGTCPISIAANSVQK
jgi:hypothetical protein